MPEPFHGVVASVVSLPSGVVEVRAVGAAGAITVLAHTHNAPAPGVPVAITVAPKEGA